MSIGKCNWNLVINISREAFEICNVAPRHTATKKDGVAVNYWRREQMKKINQGAWMGPIYVPNLHILLRMCFAPLVLHISQVTDKLLISYCTWVARSGRVLETVRTIQLHLRQQLEPPGFFTPLVVKLEPECGEALRRVARQEIFFRISHDTRSISKLFADTRVLETCTPVCCGEGCC